MACLRPQTKGWEGRGMIKREYSFIQVNGQYELVLTKYPYVSAPIGWSNGADRLDRKSSLRAAKKFARITFAQLHIMC